MNGYALDEESVRTLKELVSWWRSSATPRRQPPFKRRPMGKGGGGGGGEAAIFRLREGTEIPALDGSVAGSLSLERFTFSGDGSFAETGEEETVWNVSQTPVVGNADEFLPCLKIDGQWVALPPDLRLIRNHGDVAAQHLARCGDGGYEWRAGEVVTGIGLQSITACSWRITSTTSCGTVYQSPIFGLVGINPVTRVYCEAGQIKYDVAQCS